jgi:hypothetical protein
MGSFDQTCEPCIEMNCCNEATACYGDANCNACAMGMASSLAACAPGMSSTWDALVACATNKCPKECNPVSTCNPVTNQPCNTAMGEACDLTGSMNSLNVYVCFPPPNATDLCGACNNAGGPYCMGTQHCLENSMGMNGQCARYCCNDGDCGGGKCDTSTLPGGAGVCVQMLDAGVDPSCGGDGGPPAVAPSNGSCVMIPGQPSGDAGAG